MFTHVVGKQIYWQVYVEMVWLSLVTSRTPLRPTLVKARTLYIVLLAPAHRLIEDVNILQ